IIQVVEYHIWLRLLFFFSSRRRHTRSKRDWSSDVCSSDLVIGAKENEIYFTAGGTEADNWAIKAAYEACKEKGNHIITSKVEHRSEERRVGKEGRGRGAQAP